MTTLDQLLDALAAATPKLDGARCRNLWAAFDPPESGEDPEDVRYRHRAALALCESCPALTPCGAWIASLEPRQRPSASSLDRSTTADADGGPQA